ncbi:MAG: hypothetical protein WCE44_06655 [Candidatus Velthaea sp.]|jgi:hypothetical protein
MHSQAQPARESDLLTRTTLLIDETLSTLSMTQMIRALQRVPGVLLADMNARSDGAIVAHDAAVPMASLLAAAAGAGVRARLLVDTPAFAHPVESADPSAPWRWQPLVRIGAAIFVLLALTVLLVPAIRDKHVVVPLLITSIWIFFVTEAFLRPRP